MKTNENVRYLVAVQSKSGLGTMTRLATLRAIEALAAAHYCPYCILAEKCLPVTRSDFGNVVSTN